MKIVIDIPDEEYNMILLSDKTAMAECASKEAMMYAIKNGTPLIHCKDCKHFFYVKEDTGLCDNHGGFFTGVDGFCSIAERQIDKEEGVSNADSD